MIKRICSGVVITCILVIYAACFFLYINLQFEKEHWQQSQVELRQVLQRLQQRQQLNQLWYQQKKHMTCFDHVQAIEQVVPPIVKSLKSYGGALKEIVHKDKVVDIVVTMPVATYFQWLVSRPFQESCLLPTQIDIKKSDAISQITMHLIQVTYA